MVKRELLNMLMDSAKLIQSNGQLSKDDCLRLYGEYGHLVYNELVERNIGKVVGSYGIIKRTPQTKQFIESNIIENELSKIDYNEKREKTEHDYHVSAINTNKRTYIIAVATLIVTIATLIVSIIGVTMK